MKTIKRIDRAYLIFACDEYVNFKKNKDDGNFYFAQIDKKDFSKVGWEDMITLLESGVEFACPRNLVIEVRKMPYPKKEDGFMVIDYLIRIEEP